MRHAVLEGPVLGKNMFSPVTPTVFVHLVAYNSVIKGFLSHIAFLSSTTCLRACWSYAAWKFVCCLEDSNFAAVFITEHGATAPYSSAPDCPYRSSPAAFTVHTQGHGPMHWLLQVLGPSLLLLAIPPVTPYTPHCKLPSAIMASPCPPPPTPLNPPSVYFRSHSMCSQLLSCLSCLLTPVFHGVDC